MNRDNRGRFVTPYEAAAVLVLETAVKRAIQHLRCGDPIDAYLVLEKAGSAADVVWEAAS